METKRPVTAIIVGGGHRSMTYADYSLKHPEDLKIVGIADPNRVRCEIAAERYGFSEEFCFESAQELAKKPRFADVIINGTMDHQHYETAVPLLELGYDMLLEKPFAVSYEEMKKLIAVIRKHKNKVMICHVLRYASFYRAIKEKILDGTLGDIINIQLSEHVSYHHLSTSYIRGKWANSDICKTSMLLAKSCHDIDIMMWLMDRTRPETVSSHGSIFQFKPENAPEGAGTRCLLDCPHVDTCRYSVKPMYLGHPDRWECYVWSGLEAIKDPSLEMKEEFLRNESPYGRCIYKCDNNIVDHQSVLVKFENGATGTHNMIGGTALSLRKIHIIGTKAELHGNFEENSFSIEKIVTEAPEGFTRETFDTNTLCREGHGGGDDALTEDFISFVRTGEQSVSCTSIYNSIAGHLTVFLADKSMAEGGKPYKCDFSEF